MKKRIKTATLLPFDYLKKIGRMTPGLEKKLEEELGFPDKMKAALEETQGQKVRILGKAQIQPGATIRTVCVADLDTLKWPRPYNIPANWIGPTKTKRV